MGGPGRGRLSSLERQPPIGTRCEFEILPVQDEAVCASAKRALHTEPLKQIPGRAGETRFKRAAIPMCVADLRSARCVGVPHVYRTPTWPANATTRIPSDVRPGALVAAQQ